MKDLDDRPGPVQEVVGPASLLLHILAGDQAFEALDAEQLQMVAPAYRLGNPDRVLSCADASTPAGVADLKQYLQRWRVRFLAAPRGVHALHGVRGVDQRQDLHVRLHSTLFSHECQVGTTHEGIGDQQAANAGMDEHAGLLHVGNGDSPGARVQLPGHKVRTHRRLCVRCNEDVMLLAVGAHQLQVAFQSAFLQRRRRKVKVTRKQVPPLLSDLRYRHLSLRKAAVTPGDQTLTTERIR